MDFSTRSTQPVAPTSAAASSSAAKRNNKGGGSKWGRIGVVAAVAAVVILIVFVLVLLIASNSGNNKEASYVDSNKLQAVFLNTGQVYFGNIKTLNSKFFVLSNIYYLQTANGGQQANANASVSLVKLGCELHEPYDKMVINRDQVTFWENLQDGGQVATAVKTFEKQNPNGQKCADQSHSSSNTSNSVQNAGTSNGASNTSTTPATNNTTTTRP